MSFEDARKFDAAIKRAIKQTDGNPGDRYRAVLRDRFLCRVFKDPEERFVLKGGSGLLARIPNARATRDIDFGMHPSEPAEDALKRIDALAQANLGDFLQFRLTKCEESLDENGYSRLLKLRYATFMGHEEKDPILVDLSLDCATTLPPERLTPANRVPIEGIETSDYLVCPLPDQLADKLCAIMEKQPGGWPSSRMKDLVDVVAYITRKSFNLSQLRRAIECECARRSMSVPKAFAAPDSWESRYTAFAKKSSMPEKYTAFDAAEALAAEFYNPALADSPQGNASWSPALLEWEPDSFWT